MSQADQTIQNDTFPIVRTDINSNLAALFSNSSGATAPTVTVAYQDWIDTSGANPIWKKRNGANNAWITLGTLTSSTVAFEGTLPSQSGNSGKYLTTNGTAASWGIVDTTIDVQEFIASGTWTKPANGKLVLIRCWGGGGSGARGTNASGGGGGACSERWIKFSDLPSTVSVTIATGGAGLTVNGNGNTGGTTTFGSYSSAYGGGPGSASSYFGGGGGGWRSAGLNGSGGLGYSSINTGAFGGDANSTPVSDPGQGDYGGGGGGYPGDIGGSSTWGGGGGAGRSSTTSYAGGISLYGGSGGNNNVSTPGGFPGGGSGGSNGNTGAGGAGYCVVYTF